MATTLNGLIGIGTAPLQAAAIIGAVTANVTATGSTQGAAYSLLTPITHVSTAAASTGVVLPVVSATPGLGAQIGDEYEVFNYGANALSVYPGLGAAVASGATNAAFSVATTKSAKFVLLTTTLWGAILSA